MQPPLVSKQLPSSRLSWRESFLEREVSKEKSKDFSGFAPAAQEQGTTSASLGLK